MEKEFLDWHNKKSELNKKEHNVFFHEREIWFCYLGLNIGYEQNGDNKSFLRPVLILKKFNDRLFFGIPLTSSKKQENKFYHNFSYIKGIESTAILSQLKIIDSKRLKYLNGYIKKEDFKMIKEKLHKLIT